MKDKDLEQSIKAKIRQIAEQQGKLFNEVWQMLALERFLVRLACSPHKDKFIFKVPQLRNVAMTPPYFHDGSVANLPDAVAIMAQVQLGKTLDAATVDAIVAFLDSLTGETPVNYAPPGENVATPLVAV